MVKKRRTIGYPQLNYGRKTASGYAIAVLLNRVPYQMPNFQLPRRLPSTGNNQQ